MQENTLVHSASEFVQNLFKERLPNYLIYHTYEHTQMVTDTAMKIGKEMSLGEEGIEIVALASLFHDTGYTELYKGHEEVSIRIAEEFLRAKQYPEEKIQLISGCIHATKIPQHPKNILEEIVADADLSGFGKKSFFKNSRLLHEEWASALDINNSDIELATKDLETLMHHTYFTTYAKNSFSIQKSENVEILQKKLREHGNEIEENNAPPKLLPPHQELNQQPSENNAQLLFNLLSLNHMTLSSMADHKAQNMILSNATIISLVVSFVVKGLFDHVNLNLAIPVFLLLGVSVLTILFSVLSMRPKVNHGITSYEDILHRQSNLLFFGNFYKMPIDNFIFGLNEMIADKEFLYNSLAKDCFWLGKTVNKKYQYLRISYTIFIYGLILTLLLFLIFLIFPIKT